MKIYLWLLMFFCFAVAEAQITTQDISTEVNEVTVFIKDAQVTRKKNIAINSGKSILKFIGLSPFIKENSINIKTNEKVRVISISNQKNYLSKNETKTEIDNLISQINSIDKKIESHNIQLQIIRSEIDFLNENRKINGQQVVTSLEQLKQTASYYGVQLKNFRKEETKLKVLNANLINDKQLLKQQLKTLSSTKNYPTTEILVKIDSKTNTTLPVELSYIVENCGWYPSYDIRAKSINDPIEIVYKANVKQDSKVDWTNVKLTLSSANPNTSGVAPELIPYYMDFYSKPHTYKELEGNEISGTVYDGETGDPLPFTDVYIKGTTIGTTTDFDGKYSLLLPHKDVELVFSFVGYEVKTIKPLNTLLNVNLEPASSSLQEVVIVASNNNIDEFDDDFSGYRNVVTAIGSQELSKKGVSNAAKAKTQYKKSKISNLNLGKTDYQPTSVQFAIEKPYSISSDNKVYNVDMVSYLLPASYQYKTVPKINTNAYLIASISDWEKYSLLDGEANIFFENTYVGKTILNLAEAEEQLEISLGVDKNITITREKIKELTSKKLLGSKREESITWKISIKNNKNSSIDIEIFDQIPVATTEDIKVELIEKSKAKFYQDTGELKWILKINPLYNTECNFQYLVKYPKNRKVFIE